MARITQETEALLAGIVDGHTVADAAVAAGVSRRTAFRLLARPDVAERLEQLQRQTVDHAQSRLMALIDPAADALGDVLTADSSPTARVQAARAVFSQALAFKQAGNLRLAVIGEETAG
jgi:predicted kinase